MRAPAAQANRARQASAGVAYLVPLERVGLGPGNGAGSGCGSGIGGIGSGTGVGLGGVAARVVIAALP